MFIALILKQASGLAAGKGVFLPSTTEGAVAAATALLGEQRLLGDAGSEVVVEEHLEGEEVSILAFCDGSTAVPMPAAQDHKRALDGDKGNNTGGMGAYAPTPLIVPRQSAECHAILQVGVNLVLSAKLPCSLLVMLPDLLM